MGLAEGQTVRNLSRIGWGGPIVLLVNRAQVAVGRGMARKIVVRVEARIKNPGAEGVAENRVEQRLFRRRAARLPGADILLVGQPNVGKSVLFSRLTGVRTIASNYPGTTVGYAAGRMRFGGGIYDVVDAPGTYSLEPLDDAARVAIDLIDGAKRIVNVVDATHLERHLPLTLELIAQGKPMVVALNMSDEARHLGIEIDRGAGGAPRRAGRADRGADGRGGRAARSRPRSRGTISRDRARAGTGTSRRREDLEPRGGDRGRGAGAAPPSPHRSPNGSRT